MTELYQQLFVLPVTITIDKPDQSTAIADVSAYLDSLIVQGVIKEFSISGGVGPTYVPYTK